MRAAVFRNGDLVAAEIADPVPGPGQVRVRTLACGICGSDLHALHHAPRLVELAERTGAGLLMDLSRDIVFGHEFCAEVVDFGVDTQRTLAPGTRVCSVPVTLTPNGTQSVGYSNDAPGGFGELMLLNETLLLPVPNGLPTAHAALTEPMAVGWHAVAKAGLGDDDVPLVVGCGPVGLAVVAALRIRGARPIIASDFSPARRALAERMGADIVVDPAECSPFSSWAEAGAVEGGTVAASGRGSAVAAQRRPGVIFECVGVPGVLQQLFEGSLDRTRIVVVGVCMQQDHIEPIFAITKELNLQFVLGYTPDEFAQTLHHLAEGQIDVGPMITGHVGVTGVKQAFTDLANPDQHVKIVVEPWH
jgi:threonine dehydrogenase-like Zn-dependent dehydrogenase